MLVSYEHAFTRLFTLGARRGYAFRGGPPAGQEPPGGAPLADLNDLPARAKGKGGEPFLPPHAELRAALWFVPLDETARRAYAGASFGVAQVDARVTVVERDCADTRTWDDAAGAFSDCQFGRSSFDGRALPETRVDAWKQLGQGFAGLDVGALLALSESVALTLERKGMLTFPANGVVLEPSLGLAAGL